MRIEQEGKMGYVPTPTSQTDLIKRLLHVPDAPVRMLDPCAGEGEALSRLAKGTQAVTYGIELDGARAEQASAVLDHVKHVAIEHARIDKQAFGLMWLNPPYDRATKDTEGQSDRKEIIFLRMTSRYLVSHGILVFIIPQPQIDKNLASALVGRYRDIQVFRFEDNEYEVYKQVVIVGIRRSGPIGAGDASDKHMLKQLVEIGKGDKNALASLEEFVDQPYMIPVASNDEPMFRAAIADVEELRQDVTHSPVFSTVEKMMGSTSSHASLSTPLLPFRRTHMATLMAAGALNSAVGIGDNRHLVVGVTKKTIESVVDENDPTKEIRTEVYKTAIRLYSADGRITELE